MNIGKFLILPKRETEQINPLRIGIGMLNIFRKFRRNFIANNKILKYCLYALGEILLVVIGILIALQINHYYAKQQQLKTEIKLLKELLVDLEETENIFQAKLVFDQKVVQSKKVIINVIEQDIPWNDSLQKHFNLFNFWQDYVIKGTAYNVIQNWGITNISNDTLRKMIAQVYQYDAYNLMNTYQNEREIQLGPYNDIISTQLNWDNIHKVRPINYTEFLKNAELANRLKAFNTFSQLGYDNRSYALENITKLQTLIKDELAFLDH